MKQQYRGRWVHGPIGIRQRGTQKAVRHFEALLNPSEVSQVDDHFQPVKEHLASQLSYGELELQLVEVEAIRRRWCGGVELLELMDEAMEGAEDFEIEVEDGAIAADLRACAGVDVNSSATLSSIQNRQEFHGIPKFLAKLVFFFRWYQTEIQGVQMKLISNSIENNPSSMEINTTLV